LTAENGRLALDVFRERSTDIDLVLLDKTMPDLDGEETFRAMKAIQPDILAILTSGYQETEVTSDFVSNELAGFVQKPYLPEALAPHSNIVDSVTSMRFPICPRSCGCASMRSRRLQRWKWSRNTPPATARGVT
jgi:DNA-binding NtrC family response regulator